MACPGLARRGVLEVPCGPALPSTFLTVEGEASRQHVPLSQTVCHLMVSQTWPAFFFVYLMDVQTFGALPVGRQCSVVVEALALELEPRLLGGAPFSWLCHLSGCQFRTG